ALPRAPQPSPFLKSRYIYFLVAAFSMTQAESILFASFTVWQLLRMYALLGAINRAGDEARLPEALLRGMLFGVVFETGIVLFQRYGLHFHQTPGLLTHPNSLAMAINLVLPPA